MDKKPLKPPRPLGDDKHGIEYTALKSEVADTAKGEALSIVVLFVQVKKKKRVPFVMRFRRDFRLINLRVYDKRNGNRRSKICGSRHITS